MSLAGWDEDARWWWAHIIGAQLDCTGLEWPIDRGETSVLGQTHTPSGR